MATQQIEIRAVDKTQGTLNKVQRGLGKIDKQAKGVSLSFGKIAALAGSVFAGLGLAKTVSSLIQTGKELENLEVRLKFLFGSATEGGKAFDEMAKFASQVPFSLEEIQKGAGVLSVVSDDAEELARIMKITGNVAAVTGLDFKTASEQVQRSLSAGISAADLFREKGVRDMLGFSAGATVSAEETAEAFEKVFGPGGKFAGATDALADTLEGSLSMIGDKIFNFKKTLLEAGLFDSLKIQVQALDKALGDNAESINNVAKVMGDKLGFAVFATVEFFKSLNISMGDLILGAKVLGAVLGGAGLLAVIKGLAGGVKALTLAIARNPLGLLAVAASSLIVFLSMENGLGKTIAQVSAVLNKMGEIASNVAKFFQTQLGKVLEFLTGIFDSFIDSVVSGYNAIAEFIPFLDQVETSGAKVRESIKSLAVEGYEKVSEAIGETTDKVKDYISTSDIAQKALEEGQGILESLKSAWDESGLTYDEAAMKLRDLYEEQLGVAKAAQAEKDALQESVQALAKKNEEVKVAVSVHQKAAEAMIKASSKFSEAMMAKEIETLNAIAEHAIAIQKAALDNKKLTEEEFAESKLAIESQLQEQITKIQADALKRQEDMYMASLQKRLTDSQGAIAKSMSDEDKAFLQKKGREEKQKEINKNRIEFEKKSELEKYQFGIGQAKNFFAALGTENKKAFAAMKAMAIAEAIINTYQGATKALASYPPPFNFIAAAATVAAGFAQVSAIRAQTAQRGGTVIGGSTAVVGEDGPELIVPKQSSTVIPREVADAVGSIGGGMGEVNVNFNITTVDARDFDQLLVERRGTIVGIINNAMNQQGKVGVTA
ncbi:MAG: hypothetical protein Unbinned3585contig1000_32 [Prokaryotic dsDNA virus sp.]|nr:MAG: hypothetical protein Unbinned3585contig1000_32 [Prokaryotic dsDNA virus sp.]